MKTLLPVLMILAVSSSLLAADKSDNSPTHANVAYGPHKPNVLDIWIAEGDGPRPLHVYIHGGGWIGGDKSSKGDPQKHWLAKGISYAAINYRHTPQASLPAPVHDAAWAIQFLRSIETGPLLGHPKKRTNNQNRFGEYDSATSCVCSTLHVSVARDRRRDTH